MTLLPFLKSVRKTDGFVHLRRSSLLFIPKVPDSRYVKDIGGTWTDLGWELPRLRLYLQSLRDLYPNLTISPEVDVLDSEYGFTVVPVTPPEHLRENWNKLFEFQREAVRYLVSNPNDGAMLALSPGLGKTAVSLFAAECSGFKRVLVISPLPLTKNWIREAQKWTGRTIDLCWGKGPTSDWVVTNYDTVVRRVKEYATKRWDLIILDESILVKNRDTQRFKTLYDLRKGHSTHLWNLSGSPVSRDISDLWAQFRLQIPDAFRSFWRFAKRYCIVGDSIWSSYEIMGTRPGVDARSEFRDIMFVRNQEDVLDLPEMLFSTIDIELTARQSKVYRELLMNFTSEMASGNIVSIPARIAQLIRLQQAVSGLANLDSMETDSAKLDFLKEIVSQKLYEFPMLIWCHWQKGANQIYEALKEFVRCGIATGSRCSGSSTDTVIEDFKAGKLDCLVLSPGVGKFGHTLTNSQTVVYVDKTWEADAYIQSLRRVRRIGLGHRPVVLSLKATGTVDELIEDNLAGKAVDISNISGSDLSELLLSLSRNI